MKDVTGRELKVGDYIAYSVAKGRSACLDIAKILEIRAGRKIKVQGVWIGDFRGNELKSKPSFITYPERTCVIDPPDVIKELLK